ncbi:MAG: DUF5665 domain-containing protein [Candidatus Uhrbacteria bacterium]|nr:hypothetical protein [Patescibacteria group bacterium]MBU1906541.1 hypothetical protein [Patescibacteria group bacterium]
MSGGKKKTDSQSKYFQTPKPFWKFVLTNFAGGFFRGIGQFLGFVFVVAVIVWIISFLPLADDIKFFFSNLQGVNTLIQQYDTSDF